MNSFAYVGLLSSKFDTIAAECKKAKKGITQNQLFNLLFDEYDKEIYHEYMNFMTQEGFSVLKNNSFDVKLSQFKGRDFYWIHYVSPEVANLRKFEKAVDELKAQFQEEIMNEQRTVDRIIERRLKDFYKSDPEILSNIMKRDVNYNQIKESYLQQFMDLMGECDIPTDVGSPDVGFTSNLDTFINRQGKPSFLID